MLKLEKVPAGFDVDRAYASLLRLSDGRTEEETRQALAALVLILLNQIEETGALDEAIALVDSAMPRKTD